MIIVLTNDDGYEAAGLHAAFEELSGLGTVHVVAPKDERSACRHTITLRRPISAERRTHAGYGVSYAVDGTPHNLWALWWRYRLGADGPPPLDTFHRC